MTYFSPVPATNATVTPMKARRMERGYIASCFDGLLDAFERVICFWAKRVWIKGCGTKDGVQDVGMCVILKVV